MNAAEGGILKRLIFSKGNLVINHGMSLVALMSAFYSSSQRGSENVSSLSSWQREISGWQGQLAAVLTTGATLLGSKRKE